VDCRIFQRFAQRLESIVAVKFGASCGDIRGIVRFNAPLHRDSDEKIAVVKNNQMQAVLIPIDEYERLKSLEELDEQIAACAIVCEGVDHIDSVVTRRFGSQFYADVEVAMDGSLSLNEAHRHAEQVHARIEQECPQVKHVTVHVNPKEN